MTLMVGVVVNWPATPFLQSIRLLLSSLFSSAADPVPSGSKPRLWIHFNDIARSRSVPVSNYILFCFLKPPSINLHTMSIIKSFSDEKNPVWKQGCRSQILPGAGNVKNGRLRQPCIKVIWMLLVRGLVPGGCGSCRIRCGQRGVEVLTRWGGGGGGAGGGGAGGGGGGRGPGPGNVRQPLPHPATKTNTDFMVVYPLTELHSVLWIQIHGIWIRIQNFGPIWIRIHGCHQF